MRKKSHIALTSYLVHKIGVNELKEHRFSFYVGSILPDCVPSFLTKRHCIEDTFHIMKQEIENLVNDYDLSNEIGAFTCLKLGVITHYIADYFTYPHNSIYPGNIAAHCHYENEQKHSIRSFLKSPDVANINILKRNDYPQTVDELCNFIREIHNEYLKQEITVMVDCKYIAGVNQYVVKSIMHILQSRYDDIDLKKVKIA